MTEKTLTKYINDIIGSRDKIELTDIARKLSRKKKDMSFTDHAVLQNLVLTKYNEFAILEVMSVIEVLQMNDMFIEDIPPIDDRH